MKKLRKFTFAAALATALPLAAAPCAALAQSSPSIELPPGIYSGDRSEKVLLAQVLLDRARHSPGAIDGIMGGNTERAIRAISEPPESRSTGKSPAP